MLLLFLPALSFMSGCYDDTFLASMQEEEDYIAPFDVELTLDRTKRSVYFEIADTGSTENEQNGDDGDYVDVPEAIQMAVDNTPNGTSDPVVTDSVTGFVWTKCSAESVGVDSGSDTVPNSNPMDVTTGCTGTPVEMEWSNAVKTCRALNKFYDLKDADGNPGSDGVYETGYGGYNDWRLPRLTELLTIVNFDFEPAIDSSTFPGTIGGANEGYWTFTSKLFVGSNDTTIDYGWIVFFGYGGFFANNLTGYLPKQEDLVFETQFVRCVRGGLGE